MKSTHVQQPAPPKPASNTSSTVAARAARTMSKPPTPSEVSEALAVWRDTQERERTERAKDAAQEALDYEWRADELLTRIDGGQHKVILMPGMVPEQLDALHRALTQRGDRDWPSTDWRAPVRARRAEDKPVTEMPPASWLADQVRLSRRLRLRETLAALRRKRLAAEAAEKPRRVKPTLMRRE